MFSLGRDRNRSNSDLAARGATEAAEVIDTDVVWRFGGLCKKQFASNKLQSLDFSDNYNYAQCNNRQTNLKLQDLGNTVTLLTPSLYLSCLQTLVIIDHYYFSAVE